jgi:hypothetical protein
MVILYYVAALIALLNDRRKAKREAEFLKAAL